jgi:uroporphyrinogen-III decarboxylase
MSSNPIAPAEDQGKTPQQLYAERAKRLDDAMHLRQPDRIPIFLMLGHLLADLGGITRLEMYENTEASLAALKSSADRFQPDAVERFPGGPAMSRFLGDQMTKWPGYGRGENESFQYQEAEFMKAEDYDAFLEDPADWAIRKYLPRVFTNLKALEMLPRLGMALLGYYGMADYLPLLNMPPLASALEALVQGAQAQGKAIQGHISLIQAMAEAGYPFPPFFLGGHVSAPFDFMSDTLRGMRGIFLDIRRCPEKLLAAEEKVIPIQLETTIATCKARHMPFAIAPLHRGSDGFMSLPVFERFYWPQLKRLLLELIAAEITPVVIWEGTWDQRLQYLAELPKGKTVGLFQSSDLFKVKEVLGDTMCIVGGMPVSMLFGATPEEIRAHTKKTCEVVGKGGGFIMSTDIGEMEGCSPDLIKVWIDATREFGAY